MKHESQTSTALVRASAPMPIATVAEMQIVGDAIAQSGMFGVNNKGAGLVVAMTCHSQGISLLDFTRSYHIINNKPSMRADAMLAEFRKRGGKHKVIENSVGRAEADFSFEGQEFKGVYTMEDAQRSGDCYEKDGKTLKHNWEHRAENMLWARMISRTVRLLCPEIVSGLYTPEETEDFRGADNARVVTPISADEVKARQSAMREVPTQQVIDVAEVQVDQFAVCNFGDCCGQRWDEMPREWLEAAVELTDLEFGHKAYILNILNLLNKKEVIP